MMTTMGTTHVKYIFEDSLSLHYIMNGHFKWQCQTQHYNFKSETIYTY